MTDLIDRQAAIDALHAHLMYRMGTESNKKRLDEWINSLPSAQSEIIHCKDCKNHKDGRCLVANHHTADHECCAEAFGAKRKEDAKNSVDM